MIYNETMAFSDSVLHRRNGLHSGGTGLARLVPSEHVCGGRLLFCHDRRAQRPSAALEYALGGAGRAVCLRGDAGRADLRPDPQCVGRPECLGLRQSAL